MTLLVILAALALLAAGVLLPRVHVRVDVDLTHAGGEVDSIWFSVSGDTREKGRRGRILFFHFFRRESETAASPSASEPSRVEPSSVPVERDTRTPPPEDAATRSDKCPRKPSHKKAKPRRSEFDWSVLPAEKDLLFAVLKRIANGLWHFFKSIRTDYFDLDLTLGLGDAMATGLALGILHPLYFLCSDRRRINLTPHFDDYAFDFRMKGSFSLRPIQLLAVILREALRFPWYRALGFALRAYFDKRRRARIHVSAAAASAKSNL